MDMETLLRDTIPLLESILVPGSCSGKMDTAINNIKICVRTIERVRKQAGEERERKEVQNNED